MKQTLPQLVAILILVAIAFIATGSSPIDAWPWGRHRDTDTQQTSAQSDRLIPTTKRTIANVEDITEGVKAGIVAAGQTIESREKARLSSTEANDASILAVPVTVTVAATSPPQQQPTHSDAKAMGEAAEAQQRSSCSGGGCPNGQCGVVAATKANNDFRSFVRRRSWRK